MQIYNYFKELQNHVIQMPHKLPFPRHLGHEYLQDRIVAHPSFFSMSTEKGRNPDQLQPLHLYDPVPGMAKLNPKQPGHSFLQPHSDRIEHGSYHVHRR